MEQDPLINFLSSISDKIKVEKEHKKLMEKINTSAEPVLDKDPLEAAVNLLKQKILETKTEATPETKQDASAPVEPETPVVIEAPVATETPLEEKDTLNDFVSKLKDILGGKKEATPVQEQAPESPVQAIEDKQIEHKKEDTTPAPVEAEKNDYVKVLDKLSDDVVAEKKPEKLSKIEKLVKEYADKYIKKAVVMSEYAGGGGTNAVQYANGGTMNGDLNINGHILSGGRDISNYFGTGGSGGSQTLSFNASNADLSISGGNTVSLSALSGSVSGPTDRLVNGSYQVVLSSNGDLIFPTGSKISKGYPGLTQDDSSWFVAPTGQSGGLASADGEQYIQLSDNSPIYIGTGWPDSAHEWIFGTDGTTIFPNAAIDGGTAPIELKSRSWSQLTYNNNDMTPAPNKNHSTTFFVEGGDALLEIFRWDNDSVLQHRQWTFSSDGSLTFPDNTTQYTAYTGIPANIAYTNQDTVFEKNVTIQGNLTALGTSTFANTIFTTTSALSVYNTGLGPALYVYQGAGPYDVASFYDGDGIEVLHVGNANSGGRGFVGINESFPGAELTVNGTISGNRTITVVGGNSNQWNSVYTTVNTVSAVTIVDGGNTRGANIAIGARDAYNVALRTNNANRVWILSSGEVGIGPSLASLVNLVNSSSPNSPRLTVSGLISSNNAITVADGNSNQWNSNFTTTQNNSASWSQAYTNLTTNSGAYLSGADISLLAAASGSWNSVYTTVKSNSGSYILDGGNAKGANISIGTNDNYNLILEINGNSKLLLTSDTLSGNSNKTSFGAGSATGLYSFAEGDNSQAIGNASHAEGLFSTARGTASHAEGFQTSAFGTVSHAEGENTLASGYASHAEGILTRATGEVSHAAGGYSVAAHSRTWIWKGDTNVNTISTTRTDQFMVSAAGGVYIPGSVGIGTDNNSNALTVAGTLSANTIDINMLKTQSTVPVAGTRTLTSLFLSITVGTSSLYIPLYK